MATHDLAYLKMYPKPPFGKSRNQPERVFQWTPDTIAIGDTVIHADGTYTVTRLGTAYSRRGRPEVDVYLRPTDAV